MSVSKGEKIFDFLCLICLMMGSDSFHHIHNRPGHPKSMQLSATADVEAIGFMYILLQHS